MSLRELIVNWDFLGNSHEWISHLYIPYVAEEFAFRVTNISHNIHHFLRTDGLPNAPVSLCPQVPCTQGFTTRVTNPPVQNLTFLLKFDEYLTWHARDIYLYNSTLEFMLKCRLFFISCSWNSRVTTKRSRWSLTTNVHGVTYQRRQGHRCDKQNPRHFIIFSLFAFIPWQAKDVTRNEIWLETKHFLISAKGHASLSIRWRG